MGDVTRPQRLDLVPISRDNWIQSLGLRMRAASRFARDRRADGEGCRGEKLTLNQHGAPAHPVEADVQLVRELARFIRTETVRLIGIAKSGHYTSVFSCAEILAALYSGVMRLGDDPDAGPSRDRLILSKGHCAVGVYPLLAERGYFPSDWLDELHAPRQPARRPPRHAPRAGHRLLVGLARARPLDRGRHGGGGPAARLRRRSGSGCCSATRS